MFPLDSFAPSGSTSSCLPRPNFCPKLCYNTEHTKNHNGSCLFERGEEAFYEEWRVNNKACHQKSSASTGSQKLGNRSYRNQREGKEGCLPYNHTTKSSTETVQRSTTTHEAQAEQTSPAWEI